MNYQPYKSNFVLIVAVFLLLLYFVWFSLPVSFTGASDIRMVSAFNNDEALLLSLFRNQIDQHHFNGNYYYYPHFYFNLGLFPLGVLNYFTSLSDTFVIVYFRLISSLFLAGSILLTILIAKRFFGTVTAWVSLILLLTMPDSLHVYGIMIHPDMAQLFFICLSIFFVCNYLTNNKWKYIVIAGGAAGIAFGSKYGGFLLLTPILLACIFKPAKTERHLSRKILAIIFYAAGVLFLSPEWLNSFTTYTKAGEHSFFYGVYLLRIVSAIALLFLAGKYIYRREINVSPAIEKTAAKIEDFASTCLTFILAFTACSPGSVWKMSFIDNLIRVSDELKHGHWFADNIGIIGWSRILFEEEMLPLSVGVFAAISAIIILFRLLPIPRYSETPIPRHLSQSNYYPQGLIVVWIVFYLIFLGLTNNAPFKHYLLPVVPFVILLAGYVTELVAEYFSMRFKTISREILASIFALVFFGYITFRQGNSFILNKSVYMNWEKQSEAVKAGVWLNEHFPHEKKVLYDNYSYVPSAFRNARGVWSITRKELDDYWPDIVIVNNAISGRFSDTTKAKYFIAGADEFMQKYFMYDSLLNDKTEYATAGDFNTVKVLAIKKVLYNVCD